MNFVTPKKGITWYIKWGASIIILFAIASLSGKTKFKKVFPLIGMDFLKMMIGLSASVAIVLLIHLVLS
jgi:hypothetical protein